jgi:lipoate-protein ligase A
MAAERLMERATTVEACLGTRISWDIAAQAFVKAFQSILNLELSLSDLTAQELERADQLVREKYNHPSWTERV